MITLPDRTSLRTWTSGAPSPGRLAVLLLHGGPGIPDYLSPVAACLDDRWLVHRYDQRGVGGSAWDGDYTLDQSIADAISLLDYWGHQRVTLIGHSFGTNLASYLTLAHPERIGGLVQVAGPFLGPRWSVGQRATEQARRSPEQQERLAELNARHTLTEDEEIEHLTLSWFTDHADSTRAWQWAAESARSCRPVNMRMNRQLNAAKRATPLESRFDDLRRWQPVGTTLIGGTGDPRPHTELRNLANQLDVNLVLIPDAGHHPWLERPNEFRRHLRAAVNRQDDLAH